MDRGDIYFVSLDPALGREQKGTRPVLVISPAAFNKLTGIPVVLPITQGGDFARVNGFSVNLSGSGTETQGVVRCDQVQAIDMAARKGKKVETVPDYIVEEALDILATIVG